MVVSIGNKSYSNPNPNAANPFETQSHNNNKTGTDSYVFMWITMANSVNFGTMQYGGQTMTNIYNENRSGVSQRMGAWYLNDPPSGSNTISIGFSGSQFNAISIAMVSFGDCGGVGNTGVAGLSPTPNNKNLTVSEGSLVWVSACSINAISDIEIPVGDSRASEYTHNTNRQVESSLGDAAGMTAGTYTFRTESTSGSVSNDRTEILAVVAPPARRRVIIT